MAAAAAADVEALGVVEAVIWEVLIALVATICTGRLTVAGKFEKFRIYLK
jgi:hypothetical protein